MNFGENNPAARNSGNAYDKEQGDIKGGGNEGKNDTGGGIVNGAPILNERPAPPGGFSSFGFGNTAGGYNPNTPGGNNPFSYGARSAGQVAAASASPSMDPLVTGLIAAAIAGTIGFFAGQATKRTGRASRR